MTAAIQDFVEFGTISLLTRPARRRIDGAIVIALLRTLLSLSPWGALPESEAKMGI